ncbi:MAG: C40 family peptidase [Bacteroidales bacterium]|nr:C40 family peptidase [Bacteroidales bacterium]
MLYGISEISVIPVRKENSEQSEMLTQVLFGDTFQIIEENKDWTYIKIIADNYEGWVNSNSITKITDEDFEEINKNDIYITKNIFEDILLTNSDDVIRIPFGSALPNFNKSNNTFVINNNKYELISDSQLEGNNNIIDLAKQFVNSPYLWGGKNPFGIDCSGLTQLIYKALGEYMPRDASQQVNIGETINFITDTQAGDLAFFDNDEGLITHVGIVLEQNEIIHSSIKVRIDSLDQQGIYNKDLKKYTHKLRVIKRIIN